MTWWDMTGWKTNFNGGRPLMEDDFWWKTTFDGRWPSMEDDLWLETTFAGRLPLMEDDLRWKTTFDGGGPWMEDDLCVLVLFSLPERLTIQSCYNSSTRSSASSNLFCTNDLFRHNTTVKIFLIKFYKKNYFFHKSKYF